MSYLRMKKVYLGSPVVNIKSIPKSPSCQPRYNVDCLPRRIHKKRRIPDGTGGISYSFKTLESRTQGQRVKHNVFMLTASLIASKNPLETIKNMTSLSAA